MILGKTKLHNYYSVSSKMPYYLLTEFNFGQGQGREVRTELARCVRTNRGLNNLQFEQKTRLKNILLYGQEMREGQPSLKVFCDFV